MILTTNCNSCRKPIRVTSVAKTRSELQMEKGDTLDINCEHCGTNSKKHVNDIFAEPNKLMLITGVVLGVMATDVLWAYYGAIGTVSIIIPIIYWQRQSKAVHAFNSFMIRRK